MINLLKLYSCFLLFLSLPLISALKFDVTAHRGHESAKSERCIRNFVAKDQLVVVTVIVVLRVVFVSWAVTHTGSSPVI